MGVKRDWQSVKVCYDEVIGKSSTNRWKFYHFRISFHMTKLCHNDKLHKHSIPMVERTNIQKQYTFCLVTREFTYTWIYNNAFINIDLKAITYKNKKWGEIFFPLKMTVSCLTYVLYH